jgi:hypothetical protein
VEFDRYFEASMFRDTSAERFFKVDEGSLRHVCKLSRTFVAQRSAAAYSAAALQLTWRTSMSGSKGMIGTVAAVFALPLMAQTADDPAIGTWKLDPSKSALPTALGIKGMTRVYTLGSDGMDMVEMQELTAGGTNTVKYHFRYDGKDYPVIGSKRYDSLSVKEMHRGVTESTLKLNGALAGTNMREVSKDGKTMTMTSTMKIDGKDMPVKYHFTKQ